MIDCELLKGRIEILQFEIGQYRKEKEKLMNQIKDNKYLYIISKLTKEISNYKKASSDYKNNCKDLSKEIIAIKNKIMKIKTYNL